jgi:hypothetical protein
VVSLLFNYLLICPSNELVFVSTAEIGRSGKPEANVAWKFLKEDPFKERKKISCLVVLFSIFVLALFLPFFQYHKMLE